MIKKEGLLDQVATFTLKTCAVGPELWHLFFIEIPKNFLEFFSIYISAAN